MCVYLTAAAALGIHWLLAQVDTGLWASAARRVGHCLHTVFNFGGHGHKSLLYVCRTLGARLEERYSQVVG